MRYKLIFYTFLLCSITFVTTIFISSCCKKKQVGNNPIICAENMVDSNGVCVCDAYSLPYNGGCKNIGGGISKDTGTHYNIAVTSSCNDWRDSISIGYAYHNILSGNGFFMYTRANNATKDIQGGSADCFGIEYGNIGIYDTFFSPINTMQYHGRLPDVDFNIGARLTKNRDTIWANISILDLGPPYKVVDTCRVVLIKIK